MRVNFGRLGYPAKENAEADECFSTANYLIVAILIALPLRVLCKVKLLTHQGHMMLCQCIFSSSVVLTFVAMFYVVGRVLDITILMVAGINFEVHFLATLC